MLGKNLIQAATGAAGAGGGVLGVEDVFSTWLYTGTGSTQTIRNGIALADGVAIAPGTAIGGGYFAGFISHTADGVATHALIAAPAATGASGTGYTITTDLQWQTSASTTGATSPFDGAANTALMTSSPAANFCTGLSLGGYSDWYLPARYELDIAYYNLKPTTTLNNTAYGMNNYSVPERTVNYTAGGPAQTSVAAFQSGGAEAFVAGNHWSSTEDSSTVAWPLNFTNGGSSTGFLKTTLALVRAFRKIPINDPLLDSYRRTGEGGLVWIKKRSGTDNNVLFDTERGASILSSNLTNAASNNSNGITAFNADGFTLGAGVWGTNALNQNIASWTFRKAEKFFDVVTWTGDGSTDSGGSRLITHGLGATPGFYIVKRTDAGGSWYCYHRSLGATKAISLNGTGTPITSANWWFNVEPTSTTFSVNFNFNENGATYVAYLFAHDAGGFGDSGEESVVKCGTHYVGSGTGGEATVDLGWEPQFLLVKRSSNTGNWIMVDNMRGVGVDYTSKFAWISANLSDAENSANDGIRLTSTGFKHNDGTGGTGDHIYIAIRRGPMKTPTVGTTVFNTLAFTGSTGTSRSVGFPIDLNLQKARTQTYNSFGVSDRLRGLKESSGSGTSQLYTASTAAETVSNSASVYEAWNTTRKDGAYNNVVANIEYNFRRAPGFFDVVAYTGTGVARTVPHNLGVAPELMIVKRRNLGESWAVYSAALPATHRLRLNFDGVAVAIPAYWNSTAATASVFSVGTDNATNASASTYIAYLFATCPGVSKVGSYTGTGTTLNIDCGFAAGARFVLIKRTDSTGDWYVWDTARGIVSGNDPYLRLNSTAAEVTSTDYIDPLSSGFQITSTAPAAINASGGSFIFLAVA